MAKEKIALLTYKDNPFLLDGEQLLPSAFAAIGIEAIAVPWDVDVNWKQFSTIILRACWNYYLNRDKFLAWLDERGVDGITIWNPPEIIKWNTDKHYLLDLERKGIKIVPTVLLDPGNNTSLQQILVEKNWAEAVVKPTIGASAFGLQRFNLDTASRIDKEINRNRAWLVQNFCPEINTEGEYSLLFYGREYSHSAIKKPSVEDFRTQPKFGGHEVEINPKDEVIAQAIHVLDLVSGPILYIRVDGILIGGVLHLMELELAEPYLFFELHPQASQRFVEAYKKLTGR